MTVTTLYMIGGKVVLTDVAGGFVQIEAVTNPKQQAVQLGEPELRSLLTHLRHHALSRKRVKAKTDG